MEKQSLVHKSIGKSVSDGKCWCGCGTATPLAKKTCKNRGIIKGQPVHYILGHSRRKSPIEYIVQNAGYQTPCWIWQRALSVTGGYGQLGVNGKTRPAHRVYYERVYGPVPEGRELDHLCRNRACVNPDHLEAVTKSENIQRGKRSKLSSGHLEEIRADLSSSNRELAERYGVTRDYLACIRPDRSGSKEANQGEVSAKPMRRLFAPHFGYGYCRCGCGQKTSLAQRNEYRRGHVKGEPMPFLPRHGRCNQGQAYEEIDCGYNSLCWVWKWCKTSEGYGEACLNGKPILAHRLFYENTKGPIPKGLYIDHLCCNRACVNPEHLEAVSPSVNARRSASTKLTVEQAREILLTSGNYRVIAKTYGISVQLICDIKKGRRWKGIL